MFGERLYKLRMEKNMTMKKAGAAIGVTDGAWNKYEKNKSQPSYQILVKIADVFDVSLDYLLGRTNIRDKTFSDTVNRQQTILKEFERVSLSDPSDLIQLMESLLKCVESYNKEYIDENTFTNLLSLLGKTVSNFNKMVDQRKKESNTGDRWFPVYQKSMLEFITGYGQIVNHLKEMSYMDHKLPL